MSFFARIKCLFFASIFFFKTDFLCFDLCFTLHFVPVIVSIARTSLEGDEIKWKLRDTMGGSPRVDTGSYRGTLWETEQTVGKKLLGETEFARCDVHSVVSADQKSIINDWIFLVRIVCVYVCVCVCARGMMG